MTLLSSINFFTVPLRSAFIFVLLENPPLSIILGPDAERAGALLDTAKTDPGLQHTARQMPTKPEQRHVLTTKPEKGRCDGRQHSVGCENSGPCPHLQHLNVAPGFGPGVTCDRDRLGYPRNRRPSGVSGWTIKPCQLGQT